MCMVIISHFTHFSNPARWWTMNTMCLYAHFNQCRSESPLDSKYRLVQKRVRTVDSESEDTTNKMPAHRPSAPRAVRHRRFVFVNETRLQKNKRDMSLIEIRLYQQASVSTDMLLFVNTLSGYITRPGKFWSLHRNYSTLSRASLIL